LNFHEFLHTMYMYVLNYVVKISVLFVKYFEYYTIILRGAIFSWTGYAVWLLHGMKSVHYEYCSQAEAYLSYLLILLLVTELSGHSKHRLWLSVSDEAFPCSISWHHTWFMRCWGVCLEHGVFIVDIIFVIYFVTFCHFRYFLLCHCCNLWITDYSNTLCVKILGDLPYQQRWQTQRAAIVAVSCPTPTITTCTCVPQCRPTFF